MFARSDQKRDEHHLSVLSSSFFPSLNRFPLLSLRYLVSIQDVCSEPDRNILLLTAFIKDWISVEGGDQAAAHNATVTRCSRTHAV